jgi:hypothetical protein
MPRPKGMDWNARNYAAFARSVERFGDKWMEKVSSEGLRGGMVRWGLPEALRPAGLTVAAFSARLRRSVWKILAVGSAGWRAYFWATVGRNSSLPAAGIFTIDFHPQASSRHPAQATGVTSKREDDQTPRGGWTRVSGVAVK